MPRQSKLTTAMEAKRDGRSGDFAVLPPKRGSMVDERAAARRRRSRWLRALSDPHPLTGLKA